MKKAVFISIILLISTFGVRAQAGGGGVTGIIVLLSQRSTVLYSDTIFEIDQLKFKVTETYAFRDKVKTTLILTNQSDQFKVLHSEDIAITNCDSVAIIINHKQPMVIAPHSSKKFGLMAEGKSFKLYDIKLNVKQIFTSTEPLPIPSPGLFNLHQEGISNTKTGPLEITSIKCAGTPGGSTKAYFRLNYTGEKFLGIRGEKAMLLTADKKAYVNSWKKSIYTYYPKGKTAYTVMLEFANPTPNFGGDLCDKVSFENVFTEWTLSSNNKAIEFHVYKNGMQEGDEPKEKKDKDKEIPED
ncbi:MAG: hypothetical protein V4580_05485 [Bacteroidota bacterium]